MQRIRGFRLIDDDFMNACFDGYNEGVELLLRIILNRQDIHVTNVTTQRDKNASTELGKLMHDFFCTDADDMYYKELADKVRYFKENEKGVESMCRVLEEMRNESVWKAKVESVLRWLAMGLSHEQIAQGEGLTIEQIREIAGMKKA